MKKWRLAVLPVCLILAGCGQGDAAVSTPSAEVTAEAETTEEAVMTSVPEETAAAEVKEYDVSEVHDAYMLNDGDELIGGTYAAEGEDESVLEASGKTTASVTGSLIRKTGGDSTSTNDSNFYGINAAVRTSGNASLTLKDVTVEATAENATGVFAYEDSTITISDSIVNVTGGGAGGIQVAGGGTLYAENLTVTSASKAAIRSDRGGGVMNVTGGSYTCTGKSGAPAVYSTADITVSDAELVSTQSRAVIIEGKNSVTLINCNAEGNDQSTKEGSLRANVLLYQSASGDAKEGTSEFTMSSGTMTSLSGAMFWCTNTASVINLEDAELVLSDSGELLIVSAGRWGKEGSNGGRCTLNAADQVLNGTVTVDSVSTLDMNLSSSEFTGSISSEGTVNVVLDENSTWTLTGDSYVTSLEGDTSNINANGYHLYVNGEEVL